MPPSQLKKLKASLRESGVVGPQKSKKQKKQASKSGALREGRIQRNEALQSIRERFAPFEVKAPVRNKFDFVSRDGIAGNATKGVVGRPGVTKGLGEEQRRRTLLPQMQRRNKVGGIQDRRFGENDPTMTPEERNLQRYVKEKKRDERKASIFNLEEEEDELTHFGKPLLNGGLEGLEDFNEEDVDLSDAMEEQTLDDRPRKRQRLSEDEGASDEDRSDIDGEAHPARRKSKNEVMKEVIAKSKLHKYERQQAKEDDDDLRAELDKGMPDLFTLLRGEAKQPPPPQQSSTPNGIINPDRLALLNGKDRAQADKEYDERLKEYTFDQRSRPTVRTLTEEEKLEQEAERLKDLEERRQRRMRGEPDSEEEQVTEGANVAVEGDDDPEESDVYGLGAGIPSQQKSKELDVEDEDDFLIEDELIASGSEVEIADADDASEVSQSLLSEDEDLEFVQGLLSKEDARRSDLEITPKQSTTTAISPSANLPYTFPCPQTHAELLAITSASAITDLPVIVQRIRALYQPKLSADNKSKLAIFSTILVSHLAYLPNQPDRPPFSVVEALIRHIHSLAKTFPSEIGHAFREQLRSIQENRPLALSSGDLIVLTAISTIFPTSDHFHQVVTPAMLSMARYIGHKIPQTLSDLVTGSYVATLCLQYQRLAKRYVPEVVNYTLNALWALVPGKEKPKGIFVKHSLPGQLKISTKQRETDDAEKKLDFWDTLPSAKTSDETNDELKITLLTTHLQLVNAMVDMWSSKSAFIEIFEPFLTALAHVDSQITKLKIPPATQVSTSPSGLQNLPFLTQKQTLLTTTLTTINSLLATARTTRRPLALHNHRPLPIKTSIPKFEPSYNPTSHYDPDRQRSELSKLQAEHKKEKKGALRELRKDANFMAREQLKEKKERDGEYERKMRRLVGMVQGEEGREGKEYERVKRMRKAGAKRGRGR